MSKENMDVSIFVPVPHWFSEVEAVRLGTGVRSEELMWPRCREWGPCQLPPLLPSPLCPAEVERESMLPITSKLYEMMLHLEVFWLGDHWPLASPTFHERWLVKRTQNLEPGGLCLTLVFMYFMYDLG